MVVTITVGLAVVAVLGAIVVVALGRGGELSAEHPDHPPLALPGRRAAAGTDAALLRLPMGLWGYHKQITDAALQRFAHELTERDTRIAILEQELAEARQRLAGIAPPEPSRPPATRVDLPGPSATRAEPPAPSEWALGELPPLPEPRAYEGRPSGTDGEHRHAGSRAEDGRAGRHRADDAGAGETRADDPGTASRAYGEDTGVSGAYGGAYGEGAGGNPAEGTAATGGPEEDARAAGEAGAAADGRGAVFEMRQVVDDDARDDGGAGR